VCYNGVDVGDINDSKKKNRIQKGYGSVFLMGCVLEVCDPNTYEYADGRTKWENAITDEYHYLMRIDTWYLVPRHQVKNVVKC
jgi:hypothetical protein